MRSGNLRSVSSYIGSKLSGNEVKFSADALAFKSATWSIVRVIGTLSSGAELWAAALLLTLYPSESRRARKA